MMLLFRCVYVSFFVLCGAALCSVAFAQVTAVIDDPRITEDMSRDMAISLNDDEKKDASEQEVHRYMPVMLSEHSHEWIRMAIKSFEKKIPIATLLPDLFSIETSSESNQKDIPLPVSEAMASLEKDSVVVTSFKEAVLPPAVAPETINFQSFIRLGSDTWVAWINDKKMVYQKDDIALPDDNIYIKKMQDKRLFFLWKDSQIERLNKHWKNEFVRIAESDFYTNGRNIIVDEHNGNIGFFLSSGESFEGSRLLIYKGEAPSVPVGVSQNDITSAEAVIADNAQALGEATNAIGNEYLADEAFTFRANGIQTAGRGKIGASLASVEVDPTSPTNIPKYISSQNRRHLMTLYKILR